MGSIIDGNKKELEKEIYAHALSGEFKVHIGFRAAGTRKSNVILIIILAAVSSIFFTLLVLSLNTKFTFILITTHLSVPSVCRNRREVPQWRCVNDLDLCHETPLKYLRAEFFEHVPARSRTDQQDSCRRSNYWFRKRITKK
jgi:hypothetical protein